MKKWYYISFSLIWITGLVSCDLMGKIDEITPQHQLEKEKGVSDVESAESLVRNVYLQWRKDEITSIRPAMSFMAGSIEKLPGAFFEGGTEFEVNGVLPANEVGAALYTGLYRIINMANNAFELIGDHEIPGLTKERRAQMLAECHFHRGMAHFYLLRHYGQFCDVNSKYGVVLRDKAVEGVETAPRSSVRECYQFILKDLTIAGNEAPQTAPHYYVSRMTAKAMKAKVLLCMKDYAGAEALADSVIRYAPDLGYELGQERENNPFFDPYMQIFIDGHHSSEVLFAPYAFGDVEYCSKPRYEGYSKPSALLEQYADELGSMSLIPFLPDMRYMSVFLAEPPNVGGGDIGGDIVPDDGSGDIVFDEGDGGWYPDEGEDEGEPNGDDETRMHNNKYLYGEGVAGKQGNTYFYMRLAEVYYIYAEAAVRNGNHAGAKERLAEVVARYGYNSDDIRALPDDKSVLLELIRKHKLMDLVTENYEEWFDMVRYYYEHDLSMADLTAMKSTLISEKQLLLPIPQTALAGNNLLVPNP